MFEKIGLIGCGNMGSAVLKAVMKAKPKAEYYVNNRSAEKANAFAKENPGAKVSSAKKIAEKCDVIILGVKPHDLSAVCGELMDALHGRNDYIIISMLAGVTAEEIRRALGDACPVIVIMPNTPVAVGAGVVLYYSSGVSAEGIEAFEEAFSHAGAVVQCSAKEMNMAGSLTGCGPAMVYMFIGSLADSAVSMGLSREDAQWLAACMVTGACEMVLKSGKSTEELKNDVCSPGGTTIQMVRSLEKSGFRSSVFEALLAAAKS